jgi:oligopeptidase B
MDPAAPAPPVPRQVPFVHVAHGDERIDEYHWLRERSDPEVIAHLEAENAYTEAVMAPTKALQDTLYEEIVSRIQETDMSVPVRRGPWVYWYRTVEGLQYPLYCRRRVEGGEETVLLDENAEAAGHDYFALGALEVSPDQNLLAYSVDTEGDETHRLRIRHLDTGQDLAEEIPGTGWGAAWASDNATLFYTTLDDAKRPYRVWRHRVGTDPATDVLVHQEDDERFYCSVDRSRSGGFVVLDVSSQVTSEVWVLPAGEAEGEFSVIEPRRQNVEYSVEHHSYPGDTPGPRDRFFVLTNDSAPNFALMEAPVDSPGRDHWREVLPHRPDVRLEGVAAFADHLVVVERAEADRKSVV